MTGGPLHQGVRLGFHGGRSVFEQAAGLHDGDAGLTVVGEFGSDDPEVMFEEHALGTICQYFEILPETALLDERVGPARVRPETRARLDDEDARISWQAMQSAFLDEDPHFVNSQIARLRDKLKPGGGAATLIRVSPRLQRRTGLIRILHTAQALRERSFEEIVGGPHPLQYHAAGGEVFRSGLYVPMVLLTSPFSRGFVVDRPIVEIPVTLVLVAMHERGKGVTLRDADVTWPQVYESALPSLRQTDGEGTTWLRQVNHHAANLNADPLIRWWTGQLNALLTEATDLSRFRAPGGQLNAGNAYRELRSLERIFGACVRIQARPDEHAIRVAHALEFFDLLPNIVDRPIRASHVWSTLVNPTKAKRILTSAFAATPSDIRGVLGRRADIVLSKLREETLEQVLPGRRVGKTIAIGPDRTCILQEGDFIAELFHQLRNTHHGYELCEQRQRDVLDVHTGHISEAFPELAVLYVIAILAQPRIALAGAWF